MCKLPPLLKLTTLSLHISFLFLGRTVTAFLRLICTNELNKAGVFGAVYWSRAMACLTAAATAGTWPASPPSQTNGGTESPTSFTNVHNVASGPARAHCHPMCFPAEGFALCLQLAQGTSYWNRRPWLLSMHSAGRGQAGSRCGERKVRSLGKNPCKDFTWLQVNLYFKCQKLVLGVVFNRSCTTAWFPTWCR